MSKKINIVLWADFQCPYCLTGEENLKHAIEELGLEKDVHLDIKTCQIHDPEAGNGEKPMVEVFMDGHNLSRQEAEEQIEAINTMAREEAGLNIHFGDVHESNDFDAHRLYKYALDHGKGEDVRKALQKLYFEDCKILNDRKVLLEAARIAGLDLDDVRRMLDSNLYCREIENDEMEFEALNLQSVPYLIVDQEIVDHHPTKEEMIDLFKRHLA